MTMQSQYALDDRIKSIDDVQTCLHYDDKYIGEDGYFATDLCDLSNLSGCLHSTLAEIISDGAGDDIFRTPHDVDCDNWGCRFFIPDSLLKPIEKKYRPYTLNEFLNHYSLGDEIILRPKSDGIICHKLFVEYAEYDDGDDTVYLGSSCYGLTDLYEDCEIYTSEGWRPFGIEE